MNNHKKEADISIKMSGSDQTIRKNDESFVWVLPDGVPREKVINIEDFQKKKTIETYTEPKRKSKKSAEILLLIFFAVIIGGLFGTSMLRILPEESGTVGEEVSKISLEPINVFVEQAGVFTNLDGAEMASSELNPSVILKRDKYYVLTGISGDIQGLNKNAYVKQIATNSLQLEHVDSHFGNSLLAIRNLLNSLLLSNASEDQLTEFKKIINAEGELDNQLKELALTAIDLNEKDNNSIESKQAILQLFVNYDEFITNYEK